MGLPKDWLASDPAKKGSTAALTLLNSDPIVLPSKDAAHIGPVEVRLPLNGLRLTIEAAADPPTSHSVPFAKLPGSITSMTKLCVDAVSFRITKFPAIDIDDPVHAVGRPLHETLAPFDAQLPVHAHDVGDTSVPLKFALADPAEDVTMKLTPPALKPASACVPAAHDSAHAAAHLVI